MTVVFIAISNNIYKNCHTTFVRHIIIFIIQINAKYSDKLQKLFETS